ncbi:MAG: PD-(D/E)XK nuclease family protein [Nitriliruptoraceae bacterium]
MDSDAPVLAGFEEFAELAPSTPPLIDDEGRVRLSFSRMDTYRNCPRKFRYAYVDRIPGLGSPALSLGSSIHDALDRFYDRKLPTPPSEEELLGFLFEAWDSSGFEDLDRDEQVQFYRHAQDVLRRYHRRVLEDYRLPVATEMWFELPFEDAVVVGAIDRIDRDDDGSLHVIDYKTNRRAQPRARVAGSLQLAIYALACEHLYGQLPASVALDFVVAGVVVRVGLEEIDLDAARDAVRTTAAGIRAEEFIPTPNRLCDWCDHRALCPAWPDETQASDHLLGPVVARRTELRRQVRRELEELRALDDAVQRLTRELADDTSAPAEEPS